MKNKNKNRSKTTNCYVLYRYCEKSKSAQFSSCDFGFLEYTHSHIPHPIPMEKSIHEEQQIKKMPTKKAAVIKKMPQKQQEEVE